MFKIDIEEKGAVIIFHLYGNLSFETASEIEAEWKHQLAKKPEIIALSFKGLEYIDSMGISCLIKLSKDAILKNIEMLFYDLSGSVKKLFTAAKMDKFFNIMDKEDFELNYF